jgi:hypothetical protein
MLRSEEIPNYDGRTRAGGFFVMLRPMRRGRKVLPYGIVALLVATNVFLLAMLLYEDNILTAEPASQNTLTLPPALATSSIVVPTPTASDSRRPTASPTPSTGDESVDVVPTRRLMVAISAREAWRATVGDCKSPGRVERSINGGQTWTTAVKTDLAPIVRLGIEGNGDLYTIGGAGKDCSPRYVAYSTDGVVVGRTDSPRNLWFLGPVDRDRVYGPLGTKSTPCRRQNVVGLAALDISQALVVCTDGSAMMTTDSGKSWNKADQLAGTAAVGSGGGHYWIAREVPSCKGIAVQRLKVRGDKLVQSSRRCARALKITPSRVALDVSETVIWLWAGTKVLISTNAGRTWS